MIESWGYTSDRLTYQWDERLCLSTVKRGTLNQQFLDIIYNNKKSNENEYSTGKRRLGVM